jgi:hypothetical protein
MVFAHITTLTKWKLNKIWYNRHNGKFLKKTFIEKTFKWANLWCHRIVSCVFLFIPIVKQEKLFSLILVGVASHHVPIRYKEFIQENTESELVS